MNCNLLLVLLSLIDALQVVLRALYRYACGNNKDK